ncbi:MAG: methyltransferase, partial [Thermoplasmata archaeon]|nr:methyltransferase [Thermoplasmata archaeon]
AQAVQAAGGRVDLEQPDRRFAFDRAGEGRVRFGEQAAEVDRSVLASRRMPRLPFRRPVSLPPKLGRVAANLARVRPGDRVVDPFLGTGALAVESALLGARVTGLDSDATMVRGALANFAHLALEPEAVLVADSGAVDPAGQFDALVTDPPYGRASTTGGEDAAALVERVVGHWANAVRPSGRLVVVMPGGGDPVGVPWRRIASIPDRVHRSLTREFRIYERDPAGPGEPESTAS